MLLLTLKVSSARTMGKFQCRAREAKNVQNKKLFRLSLTENNRNVEDVKSRGGVLKLKTVHWISETVLVRGSERIAERNLLSFNSRTR